MTTEHFTSYLASVPAVRRLVIRGLLPGSSKLIRTVAGMVSVVTGVLAGSTAGIVAVAVSSSHTVSLASGLAVGVAVMAALIGYQFAEWYQAMQEPMCEDQ